MTQKFDFYDILAILIPGILLLVWIAVCFPAVGVITQSSDLPPGFASLALTALAVFLGQLVQSLASLLEGFLFWTWGGRPSDQAFDRGIDRYLPDRDAQRIRARLEKALGDEDATPQSLFLHAASLAGTEASSRATLFQSHYAYHRGLVIWALLAGLILTASTFSGEAATWSRGLLFAASAFLLMNLLLFWHRAKQKSFYYVREVLITADRVMEQASGT